MSLLGSSVRAMAAAVLLLVVSEGLARSVGPGVWRPFDSFADVPTLAVSDPALGWTDKPGTHRWTVDGQAVTVQIDPDGTRHTPQGRGAQV